AHLAAADRGDGDRAEEHERCKHDGGVAPGERGPGDEAEKHGQGQGPERDDGELAGEAARPGPQDEATGPAVPEDPDDDEHEEKSAEDLAVVGVAAAEVVDGV